jgi:hypothetical protein
MSSAQTITSIEEYEIGHDEIRRAVSDPIAAAGLLRSAAMTSGGTITQHRPRNNATKKATSENDSATFGHRDAAVPMCREHVQFYQKLSFTINRAVIFPALDTTPKNINVKLKQIVSNCVGYAALNLTIMVI